MASLFDGGAAPLAAPSGQPRTRRLIKALDDGLAALNALNPMNLRGASGGSLISGIKLGVQKAVGQAPVDLGPSGHFARITPEHFREKVGTLSVEVLEAGGWAAASVAGDVLTAEDVYVLLCVDGLVARTCTRFDARAPTWPRDSRRAFAFDLSDPRGSLFVAALDEDDESLASDGFIGRCGLALRSLRAGATYDAWLPLRKENSRQEEDAIAARIRVASLAPDRAASADATQAKSRGAVRVRLRVDWDDGGVGAARSVASWFVGRPPRRTVELPWTWSGRKQREAVRFALYGENADGGDRNEEPVATARLRDHVVELLDMGNGFADALKKAALDVALWRRPLRSACALFAWLSTCSNGSRLWGWGFLLMSASLFDNLRGREAASRIEAPHRAGQESEIPNFKGSFLGRFPLVSAVFWTSDHLSERSRSVNAFPGTRARGTLTLKRR